MDKIHIIGNKYCYFQFHHPIRVFERELTANGLKVRYFTRLDDPRIKDCEVLIFHEDNYRHMLPIEDKSRQSAVEFLSRFFEPFKKVIWYDANAGSGWLRSYIFPLIDIYAKNQLLKDTSYYQEIHPIGIKHRDYVCEKFGIEDPLKMKAPLSFQDVKKLRPSWTRALREWRQTGVIYVDWFLRNLWKNPYSFRFSPPNLPSRSTVIPYRMNYWKNVPTVTWWRTQTRTKLEEMISKNDKFQLKADGRVSKREYQRELQQAVITVSPFGLGELCYRDFEAFINGSLLFKPSMEHITTYPNLYRNGETYIAHRWDFSDFEEKLTDILANPAKYEDVAREGQKRFKEALADGEGFVTQFKQMIS